MSDEEVLRAYEKYGPAELVAEARRYLEAAREEADPRRKAEKGYLAATLAADAFILWKGFQRPRSLYERERMLGKLDPNWEKDYVLYVERLYRRCLCDGACDGKEIDSTLEELRAFIGRVEREVRGG